MSKQIIIILIIISGISFRIKAQDTTINLSAEEAVNYALEHNKTLLNVKEDLRIAETQIKESRAPGLPQVSASVDYMTNFNYEAELDFGGGGNDTPPAIDYTVLDTGDYEIMSLLDQMFSSSGPSVIKMTDQASANLQVSQLIFGGQYWVGMRMSKLSKEIYQTNLTITELDIKEQILNSYYLILITKELIEIMESNEANLKEIYTHTENMAKAGMAMQTDVDQIKISLSQLENSRRGLERNLRLSYTMLKFVLGTDSNADIVLTDDLAKLLEKYEDIALEDIDFNLKNNPNYQILTIQESISEENIQLQKWAYAPTLVGFYSYTEKIMTSGFDLTPKHAAGLTLSIPIYSGGSVNAKVSQAKIEMDKVQRNKSLLEDQLRLQDNQLLFEYSNALDNYITQKENVETAKRLYKSMNDKYKQGLISSLELSQANSDYLMAQNNFYSAVMDLFQSELKIKKLHNNL